ncbi:hypothetical protein [Aquirufa sp. 5-AUSEE-100C1]
MIFLKKFKLTFTLIFGFILYGVSSFFYIRIFELGHLKYDFVLNDYIIFQVFSIIIAFLFELSKFRYSIEARYVSHKRQNHFFVYFVFLICCIVFFFFPWVEDRESVMAQFAGFLRLLWFSILISFLDGSKKDYKFLILNFFLMFIDSSRSTFAAIFLIHFFRREKFNFWMISMGTICIFLVASIRSDIFNFNSLFESLFLFGFVGEGINGSLGSLQILSAKTPIDIALFSSFSSFFQPFLVIPKYLIFYLNYSTYLDTSHFDTLLINQKLGENYYPMGGFYLVSQFIQLSYFGAILLVLYLIFSLRLVGFLFKKADFALQFTLLILMIKMSPFTFWKWLIYLYLIKVFVYFIKSLILRVNNRI